MDNDRECAGKCPSIRPDRNWQGEEKSSRMAITSGESGPFLWKYGKPAPCCRGLFPSRPVPTGCVRFAHPPENLRLRKGLSQQQALQRQAVDLRQLLQILHFHVFVELVDGGVPRAYFHYLRADVGDEAAVRSAAGC